jgi:hypothetical protein
MALQQRDSHFLIYEVILSLSRAVVPLIQGFEDAGDFTVTERLKTSLHVNFIFYLVVGSIGLFGLILVIMMNKNGFVPHSLIAYLSF